MDRETNKQALIRECQEELAITVGPHEVFAEITHEHPDLTVHNAIKMHHIAGGNCNF